VIEEPQEEGALILVGGCWVMQRKANGCWYLMNQRDITVEEITWADIIDKWINTFGADGGSLIRLHQGETGPLLQRQLAIRVDEAHPRRPERVGTVLHWAEETVLGAPAIWPGWTIVERWVTPWEDHV
jgi:hypothetical protein